MQTAADSSTQVTFASNLSVETNHVTLGIQKNADTEINAEEE